MTPQPRPSRPEGEQQSPPAQRLPETVTDNARTGPWVPAAAAGPTLSVPGYEVLEELGRGGMGIVYKARHLKLKRLVALKMIRAGAEAGPDDLERFRREGEAVARLQHPNIVQIYEVGDLDGRPFFSLEFVEGGSLASRLTGDALPPRQAAELVRTLAEAVDAAHQRGIVHRDLKPANVLIGADGQPKIGDFGLAKQLGEDSGQTRSGAIMGTPSYMAPEQARGDVREIGPACDVWALGAILYELLTGRPPFRGPTTLDTLEQVCGRDPVRPRRVRSRVPRDLETVCLKCLQKEPRRRYATARDLANDLRAFLECRPVHARPVGLTERTLKWVRRRPAVTLAVALAVCTLAAGGWGYRLWLSGRETQEREEKARLAQQERDRAEAERQRERIDYFVGFVRRRGGPKGVGALRVADVPHRSYSLRFHSRNGLVERIDVVNGHGNLTTAHPLTPLVEPRPAVPRRECSYHFKRDKQGRLTGEIAYDRRGHIVWWLNYTPGDTAFAWYTDWYGRLQTRSASRVSHLQFTYDPEGYEREIRFLDADQRPRPDDNGVHGMRLDHDRQGRVRQVTYLGIDGRPQLGKDGTAGSRTSYDEQDRWVEIASLDVAGKPGRHEDGYHKGTARYDSFGNVVELAYWDVRGRPARHREGFHKVRLQVTETGEPEELSYLGADDRPVAVAGGVARLQVRYDTRGNRTEEIGFDAAGRRAAAARGNSRWVAAYDEGGFMIRQAFFDARDEPLTLPEGYHSWTAEYDDRGNLTAKAFFDRRGRPAVTTEGVHRWTASFDATGLLVAVAYFGPNGRPVASRDGAVRWTQTFDRAGRLQEKRYFGEGNKPVTVPDGFAIERHHYDARGVAEIISYFDGQDRPVRHRDGYYEVGINWMQWQRTAIQLFIYYDAAGQPTVTRDGYGIMAVMRDGRGNITTAMYLDKGLELGPNGQLSLKTVHRDGYLGWRATYDEQNHQTEVVYFGPRSEPIYHRAGYARITRTFDAGGKQTGETRWLLDRNRAYIYARERRNAAGEVAERAYFTADNRPATHSDGYHVQRNRYDARGRCVEVTYFDKDGKPARHAYGNHKLALRHDEQGREVEKRYYAADGRPTPGADGFSRWAAKYDGQGRRVEETYFGPDDKPVVSRAGHARLSSKYDKGGRLTERSFWIVDAAGSYVLQRTLDAQDRVLEYAFFDSHGKPSKAANGVHRFTARYDAAGRRIEEVYFDSSGRPANRPDGPVGYHVWTAQFDGGGRQTEIAYFGLQREPVLHREGYHKRTTRYNARGLEAERADFGTDNKPIVSAEGFARATMLYDEKGNRKEFSYFGADNKPIRTRDGVARLVWTRNAAGVEVKMAGFDEQGKPLPLRTQILSVNPGGLAERGGLKAGDVIVTYDGKEVEDYVQFLRLCGAEHAAGTEQKLTVLRTGKTLSFTIPPGELGLTLKPLVLPPTPPGRSD